MRPNSTNSSFHSVALLLGALALFACWLVPGHYFPWIAFQNEALAALAGLLFGVAALAVRDGPPRWPAASSVLALTALIPPLQWVAGQISFRSDAVLSFLYLAALSLCVSAGATLALADRKKLLDSLFGALLAAGIVSVGMAMAQWLNLGLTDLVEWLPPGYRAIGNIAQPNHLAALLALSVLSALWFYETRRIGGAALALVCIWLVFGMALTRSRMIWLAAVVFALWWLWMDRRTTLRLRPALLLVGLGVLAIAVVGLGALSDLLQTHSPESLAKRLQTGGGRLRIWAALVDGVMQSPWVGYGWSQVSRAGLAGSLNHYTGESMLRQSHSVPLDLLAWVGIPLGLLLMGLVALWWWRQLRRCDSAERALALSVVGLLTLYSLIEFPLESFFFLVPCGLCVGALEGWSAAKPPAAAPRTALGVGLAGVAVLGFAVAVEYLAVEDASRRGRMRAAGLAVDLTLPSPTLLDEPIEYIRFWFSSAKPGMTPEELDWMRRIVGRNPAPPSLLRYATAAGLNGQPMVAAQTLIRLCNMHRALRCDEGRRSWSQLQQNFPALQSIAYPPTPAEP
jgi:O-antigen ligase